MFLDSANIPAGSEILLLFGGYMSKISKLDLHALILITTISTTIGAILNYYLGMWGGEPLFKRFGKYFFITEDDYANAVNWLNKYGNFAGFFGRLIPGIRTFISFPAGVAKVKVVPFSLWTLAGSLVWCAAFCYIGSSLGAKWKSIYVYLKEFHIIIAVMVFILISVFIWHKIKSRVK